MDKIKEQASAVGQLVFSSDTGDLYKKTLTRTWDIIREIAVLLWLLVCLVFVGGEWFYHASVDLGRSTRVWYTNFKAEREAPAEAQPLGSTGQVMLDTVKSGTSYVLSQARKQLGLPDPEPKAPAAAAPAAAPAAPPAPAPTASPTSLSAVPATPDVERFGVDHAADSDPDSDPDSDETDSAL